MVPATSPTGSAEHASGDQPLPRAPAPQPKPAGAGAVERPEIRLRPEIARRIEIGQGGYGDTGELGEGVVCQGPAGMFTGAKRAVERLRFVAQRRQCADAGDADAQRHAGTARKSTEALLPPKA
jgi:hypothetical protein